MSVYSRYARMHKMTVLKLSVVALIVVTFAWYWRGGTRDVIFDHLDISVTDRRIHVRSLSGLAHALDGELGVGLPDSTAVTSCGTSPSESCVLFENKAKLMVTSHVLGSDAAKCYKISWVSLSRDFNPTDCYNMTESHWFGGSEFYEQRWPVQWQEIPMQQYRSNDFLLDASSRKLTGPVVEPYWFNSRGVAILVDDHVPLHVGLNDNKDGRLCLRADTAGTQTAKSQKAHLELSYMVCTGHDAKEIHQFMAATFINHPRGLPDERVLRSPIWSSWARYKTRVTQNDVMQYADDIEKYGFSHSQIEIDDMYTRTYGDFDFNPAKFPDPGRMTHELHQRGFRVTSWITPFANLDSQAFTEGMEKGYWVLDAKGRVPGLVKWWQGIGAVLDVTNPNASDWFVRRLEQVRGQFGIDSFKFDAGEVSHLPQFINTHQPLANPNDYTRYYARMVQRLGDAVEMRAAYRTQEHAMLVRMMDKDSVWGYNNGLKTMIPTALVMSMIGYHYILPDMIGGNGYNWEDPDNDSGKPSKELFIRWLQLSAYLPSMQFSFTPWQYDQDTIDIALDMVRRHERRVTPVVIKAAQQMIQSGTPIIRPIWWLDPDDPDALACDSEFLVGDEILVAPILDDGARMRYIYLPTGRWHDDLRDKVIMGPTWVRDYPAQLKDIPTFTLLGS